MITVLLAIYWRIRHAENICSEATFYLPWNYTVISNKKHYLHEYLSFIRVPE